MEAIQIVELMVLGLISGLLGGLLGIGGSLVMIPVLTIVLGPDQHLYQAVAMIVNVFVAAPATWRHARLKGIRWDVVWRALPTGVAFIVLGVVVSDQFEPRALQQVFGVFLLYVIFVNVMKLVRHEPEPTRGEQRATWPRVGLVGAITGFMAGLLGIGGGIILVPLLQRVCVLPLRQCIACSSAIMCLTAIVGAWRKNMTLPMHDHVVVDSLLIAATLAPTALLGGLLGASATHVLPLRGIRAAFVILMIWAAARMIGLI